MTPEQETKIESLLGLLIERVDRLEGIMGNHAAATAADMRALTETVRNLASELLEHRSDIAKLKGDTDPSPPLPNGEAA